jgi:hypothetical protein
LRRRLFLVHENFPTLHGARRMAANNKCLAESNKSEGRGPATKRHDNDFAQIPFRGSMHPAGRNDRGHRDPLLLPPSLQRRIDLCRQKIAGNPNRPVPGVPGLARQPATRIVRRIAGEGHYTSRRMASERSGLSVCLAAQASTFSRNSDESWIAVTGARPVAGLPLFFRTTFLRAASRSAEDHTALGRAETRATANSKHGL